MAAMGRHPAGAPAACPGPGVGVCGVASSSLPPRPGRQGSPPPERTRPTQGDEGTQEPWKPKGTRAGRCTVATGGPPKEVASRTTRSLASRVAS